MNDASPTSCPRCGAALPAGTSDGLCPACLLSGAVDAEAPTVPMPDAAERKTAAPFAIPVMEELSALFPQLEILELLGRGGMGAVFKARQKNLDRFVALKILTIDPTEEGAFGDRFQREAKALAKLNHPNIVSVFDFGVIDGLYYFLMEYVDGANLRALMQSGEMKPEAALALIPSFCDALQYAHDEGVVHRDIKPENVLVDKKGRVKIADFGLAKLLGQDSADHALTRTGMYLGTPRYMAPEQIDRPESVDHRADIYSLGVVFYEMLTGEVPMGRFALPSEKVQVDVKLDEIVLRSLERDVERRYQHVSEIKTDVENVSLAFERMPLHLRQMMGWEYRSRKTLFGLPLLHIAYGLDPVSGRRRTAKGIVAVGERAVGVVAFGGMACGGIVFGGLGIGLVSFSGLALGLVSMGGLALGLLLAYGGLAAAPFAIGGLAAGWVATGGAAFGGHVLSGSSSDPLAKEFFEAWALPINVLFYTMLVVGVGVPFVAHFLGRRWEREMTGGPPPAGAGVGSVAGECEPLLSRGALWGAIWAFLGTIAAIPALFVSRTVPVGPETAVAAPTPQEHFFFTILMGLLLLIAISAPIGTTILGAVSVHKIKRSGGKLYGLPLAFADVVFFPMLLLHGAMAVLLGLLVVTLIQLAGVNAGLGAAEMGLLAMLPLIADFFIVRSLWRRTVGPGADSPGAVPPVDSGSGRRFLSTILSLLSIMCLLAGLSFEAKASGTPDGTEKVVTVGAIDPLYFSESGPSGFQWKFNVISWSGFAVFVGLSAFGALWRIGREDRGKVPRDPAWWRSWWIQIAVIGGLLLLACLVRTAINPEAVFRYNTPKIASVSSPGKEENVTYLEGHRSPVRAVAGTPDGRSLGSGPSRPTATSPSSRSPSPTPR